MLVLNDIELIDCLKPLRLLKDKEFYISNIFMSKNYLDIIQKQWMRAYHDEGKIVIFELENDFYKFYNENLIHNNIGIASMSSVFYCMRNKLPLITVSGLVKKFATEMNVDVFDFNQALTKINTAQGHIEYINNVMLKM